MSSGPASRPTGMETERVTASTTIEAAPQAVFAVLADPSAHADIDGTGWVRASLNGDRITAAGQVFRMAMYHENHPDKDYKVANPVTKNPTNPQPTRRRKTRPIPKKPVPIAPTDSHTRA
jgi:hypothetical protein